MSLHDVGRDILPSVLRTDEFSLAVKREMLQ